MLTKLGIRLPAVLFCALLAGVSLGGIAQAEPPSPAPYPADVGDRDADAARPHGHDSPEELAGGLNQQTAKVNIDVRLRLEQDGALTVTERINTPEGTALSKQVPLRVATSDTEDRVYQVRDVTTEGAAEAGVADDALRISSSGGPATVRYTVLGAVANLAGHQEIRWRLASGWDQPVDAVTASVSTPNAPTSPNCLAGPVGSTTQCTRAVLEHTGGLVITQDGLAPGERMDLSVSQPAGTVPANAEFATVATLATAFALTVPSVVALIAVALVLLVGLVLVLRARRRDAAAWQGPAPQVDVLLSDGQRVVFASPDGVLPGQVGTVTDEHVDVVDVTATVIDLAVRNYLWIAETVGADGLADWQLSRRNAPDEQLHEYERAVYEALLPQGTEQVLLSELRARSNPVRLDTVRAALYSDVLRQGWLARDPQATSRRWLWLGGGIAALGVLGALALALTVGHALTGVAVLLLGLGVLLGANLLPARTARGSQLVRQMRGLLDYLHTARATDIPAADREMVFSRALPYAVVLGETSHWLTQLGEVNPSDNGVPGLYWFGGSEGEENLGRFSGHFPAFVAALDGVLAESGHVRSLRPAEESAPAPVAG
ncbi:DUF2207 family protein [Tamaricihabitans halophyticus]|uniref:DUF2207 family protein n=1 Tax=Tamaricihabitans halophyticus TaxID=1262583 RepID=UPI001FB22140|nr:DUF2207 domain-containing protein [Tamaricihabitans halophyticus]